MKPFRIKVIERPHLPNLYVVQERNFGTWGFWIISGYRDDNGVWHDAWFYGLQDAIEYVEEELSKPHSIKTVKEY